LKGCGVVQRGPALLNGFKKRTASSEKLKPLFVLEKWVNSYNKSMSQTREERETKSKEGGERKKILEKQKDGHTHTHTQRQLEKEM
jgi:hypothetical protein